jgi:dCMP deaminase
MTSNRPSWDAYLMAIAHAVATRATCDRKHVGALLVRDHRIFATGYNGSIPGAPHCDDVGHMMEDGHCVRTVHAEHNAIAQATIHGVSTRESDLYVTASPCWPCFKLIASVGIQRIVFAEFYRDERIFDAAKRACIELVHFDTQSGFRKMIPPALGDLDDND